MMLRREISLLLALLALAGLATALQPRFLSPGNLRNLLLWMPLLIVAAMGQATVILTRGVDISVGSIMALSGMTTAILLRDNPSLPVPAALMLCVGMGAALGATNGVLIAYGRIPPIVATLGTMGIYRGLTFTVSGGRQVNDYQIPQALKVWSLEGVLGIPFVVWLALLVALFLHLFLTFTRPGRDLYALGGEPQAAALRGVPVNRTTMLAYILCGAGAGLAGLLYASRFGTVNPGSIGMGFELLVIAATVIGGISVFGGVGTASGVLLGCLLLAVVNVALTVLRLEGTHQTAIYGLVLLVAIAADGGLARLKQRGGIA